MKHPWQRVVAAGALTAMLAACGGIRVAGTTAPWTDGWTVLELPNPTTMRLSADADTTTHDHGRWATKSLGDQEWLIAGADPARSVHWVTYLAFDLHAVPYGATASAANLSLSSSTQIPTDSDGGFSVYEVLESWDESELAWHDAPWLAAEPLARIEVGETSDSADVTEFVNTALEQGRTSIGLAIVPTEPWATGRRQWLSRESQAEEPDPATSTAPAIEITFGEPPPAPSAAQRDVRRGGRNDIGAP